MAIHTLEDLKTGKLKGTTRLKLSCNLEEFPTEIFTLADTLEILDLSGNKLTSLPAEISCLTKLRIAFFSDNLFTVYPAELASCKQLSMIGFKANKIVIIPDNAFTPALRWLILTDNCLSEIPASLGDCPLLQKLMLAGNQLSSLPSSLANCTNLELLRISANQFESLPDWLLEMPRLTWLAFAGNPLNAHLRPQHSLPEITWDSLVIAEQLGEGASGIISKAHWQQEEVAVKVFKGAITSDGLPADEMKACMAIGQHPNLIKVIGKIAAHPANKQGLVFTIIPSHFTNLGGPPSFETCTRDTFDDDTTFTIEAVIHILKGMASVLFHLHQQGIVHADFYAHNILVNQEAFPLLSDFGAANFYDRKDIQVSKAIERMEVRAFGCLIDDLISRIDVEEQTTTQNALNRLKTSCMQESVQERPTLSEVIEELNRL
ncbi:MAG: leucine-rich repeat-containing protein kinase family protein [Spirosomataceae bacterium]